MSAPNDDNQARSITFISRSAPYGNYQPNLCLDMALASAVFEQVVNYVFLDDGVLQLLRGQQAEGIHSKTLGNALETLELYGIENVFVDGASLQQRKLKQKDLIMDVTLVDHSALSELIENSETVFNL